VFLFAGNIGKVQNLENVLQGFARACRAEPGFARLRIVGDGSALDGLREQAAMAGVPVEFPGRRPAQDMGEEYDQADFLVLSLADEPVLRLTVPAKFQMYLSVGKPVLCAAGGEVSRQVRDGALGVVTDPRDPGDIARGFLAMRAAPPAQVAQWSANAAAALARDFDRNTIIGSIQQTLERLLGEGG
jgi:glycosyltransferase involved in cell wall biosynthesis